MSHQSFIAGRDFEPKKQRLRPTGDGAEAAVGNLNPEGDGGTRVRLVNAKGLHRFHGTSSRMAPADHRKIAGPDAVRRRFRTSPAGLNFWARAAKDSFDFAVREREALVLIDAVATHRISMSTNDAVFSDVSNDYHDVRESSDVLPFADPR
jgi:hypothetical protein